MSIILTLSKLCLRGSCSSSTRSICTSSQLLLRTTPALCAEPLKKKKKMDPAVLKAREDRRRKKLEKQIRRLEKNARQLKPIDELEVPLHLIDEKEKRTRTLSKLSPQIVEQRAILEKTWARYKVHEKLKEFQQVDKLLLAQEKALQELRYESEDLYQEAIQPDLELIPIKITGPVATPPIPKYDSPDGEYINKTKTFE